MFKFTRIFIPLLLLAVTFQSCKDKIDEKLTISPKARFSVDASTHTETVTITAGSSWTIKQNGSWLSADPAEGKKGTTTVTIKIEANTESGSRNGSLTVSAPDISKTYVITVAQAAPAAVSGINEWIYRTLCNNYYWNKSVKAANPNYDLAYNAFLNNLLTNLTGAEEADGTMDGSWVRNSQGQLVHSLYSYITRTAATRAEGVEQTFGMGVIPVSVGTVEGKTVYYFLITWIQPGGPADQASLKRGMWITKYNDALINSDNRLNAYYHIVYHEGGAQLNIATIDNLQASTETPHTFSSTTMEVTPVIYSDVLTTPGNKKVGYLVYNEFARGASAAGNTFKFDNEVRSVFNDFKTAGVDELVLDLRYNPGGYVSSCQVLTGLIASGAASTDIFAKLKYNDDITTSNPRIYYYLNEGNRLPNLTRVIVLAKDNSASASEMVISSLRGIKGDNFVVHIGEQTEGKNVGMDQYTTTMGGYNYEMWPITFKIYNAKDFADYAHGFTPNYNIDEYRSFTKAGGDGMIYDFGDPNEELLKAALTLIDGGTPTVNTRTLTASSGMEVEPLPALRPRGGAKVIPSETEETEEQR